MKKIQLVVYPVSIEGQDINFETEPARLNAIKKFGGVVRDIIRIDMNVYSSSEDYEQDTKAQEQRLTAIRERALYKIADKLSEREIKALGLHESFPDYFEFDKD